MKRKKGLTLIICAFMILSMTGIFAGCGNGINKIVISGDPEVVEIMEKLAYVYSQKTGVVIDINATGAALGYKDVTEGISDIGVMARKLQNEEADNVTTTGAYICREGLVLVTSADFKIELFPRVSKESIGDFFWKEEANWYSVLKNYLQYSGSNEQKDYFEKLPLIPVNRSQTNGVREAFDQYTNLRFGDIGAKRYPNYESKNTIIANSEGEVIELVKSTLGAIGYVRHSTYEAYKDDVVALPLSSGIRGDLNSYEPNMFNIKANTYPFQRKFWYFTNKNGVSDAAAKFLKWINSDEAAIIGTYDYLVIDVIKDTADKK